MTDRDGNTLSVGDTVEAVSLSDAQVENWRIRNGDYFFVHSLIGGSNWIGLAHEDGTELTPPLGRANTFRASRFVLVDNPTPNY
jgi:hypothetical protein